MKSFMPFIIVLVCIGMYYLYISPLLVSIDDQKVTLEKYNSVLQKAKELTAKRNTEIAAYNNILDSDIVRLNKIVPETFDPIAFLSEFSSTVARYGLTLKDFSTGESKTSSRGVESVDTSGQSYNTVTFKVSIVGQYDQFIKFLKDVESNLRLMDVVSLSIRSSASGGSIKSTDNNLDYTLDINTYVLK